MGETFQKQVNVREADSKAKGNTKTEAAEMPTKASVEKELKVEAKAEEKTKVAEALKKSEKAAEKPTIKPATTATPAAAKAPEAKKEEKEEKPAEKREIVLERVYTIPLEDAYAKPAKKRAARAVKILRQFLSRHMKSQNVKISPEVNEFIEERGATSPAKKVRVNASKDKAGMVLAKLAGME